MHTAVSLIGSVCVCVCDLHLNYICGSKCHCKLSNGDCHVCPYVSGALCLLLQPSAAECVYNLSLNLLAMCANVSYLCLHVCYIVVRLGPELYD